jgi:hypothetical protein
VQSAALSLLWCLNRKPILAKCVVSCCNADDASCFYSWSSDLCELVNVNGCCRAFYDADDLQAARRWLQKALHLAPAQPVLRFNIAAVMQVGTGLQRFWGSTPYICQYHIGCGFVSASVQAAHRPPTDWSSNTASDGVQNAKHPMCSNRRCGR